MKRSEYPHVVIAGAARTPVGLKCGTLSNFSPEDLGVFAAEEAIRRSGVARERIDAAIGANVYQYTAPGTQDIYFPRNVALRCHLKTETPGLLVQRICASGLQTVVNAFQQIALPDAVDDTKIALCVGAETMSRVPQVIRSPRRSGASFWEFVEGGTVEDMLLAGLNHDLASTAMMLTADEYGAQMGVTRRECDEFADLSHSRARAAYRKSHFNGGYSRSMQRIFPVGRCTWPETSASAKRHWKCLKNSRASPPTAWFLPVTQARSATVRRRRLSPIEPRPKSKACRPATKSQAMAWPPSIRA